MLPDFATRWQSTSTTIQPNWTDTIKEKHTDSKGKCSWFHFPWALIFLIWDRVLKPLVFDVITLGSVCLQGCWLNILARGITLKDQGNLIKRFSYLSLKGVWCMLWQIEVAGRKREDVVLLSCQKIDTRTDWRRGWTSWTARHTICQIQACCALQKLWKISALYVQTQLNDSCGFSTLKVIHGSCAWAHPITVCEELFDRQEMW